jgi:hypothetical protein
LQRPGLAVMVDFLRVEGSWGPNWGSIMMNWASRVGGIALAGLLATSAVQAREVSSRAADAETLLTAGKTSEAVAALDDAVDAFWKAAPLTFKKAIFVDSAKGFGDYVPTATLHFAPGATVQVYAEPIGYGWSVAGNAYRIAFSTTVEIHDSKGLTITKAAAPTTLERLLKAKSREFQITFGFALPQIKPGDYTLVLKVTDAATAKTATLNLPFSVAG